MSTDVQTGRLTSEQYKNNFCDMHPPLTDAKAKLDANRCFYCFDAPCITACPTGINIPSFIKKIEQDNLKGAAITILDSNIMGGTCARVCPVESLCEGACVRHTGEKTPVNIGQLQRHATDYLFEKGIQPFKRAADTGKKIAIVGGGPAGLSCAHKLATLGHQVSVFESKSKLGGLNEYGLAAYKVVDNFAQKEIDFLLSIGGITVHTDHALGKEIEFSQLRNDYDAVFLGMGLSGVNALRLEDENIEGVIDAVHYIEDLRQAKDLSTLSVGRRVVVIGGGSTAIDIAVQSKRLGAEHVTLVYRRGEENMKATPVERIFAKENNVYFRTWGRPHKLLSENNTVTGITFEKTKLNNNKLCGTEEYFTIKADIVFKAIGQVLIPNGNALDIDNGRILVDENKQTNLKDVFAGGDCINAGELTVTAVEDGKVAAQSIHRMLGAPHG